MQPPTRARNAPTPQSPRRARAAAYATPPVPASASPTPRLSLARPSRCASVAEAESEHVPLLAPQRTPKVPAPRAPRPAPRVPRPAPRAPPPPPSYAGPISKTALSWPRSAMASGCVAGCDLPAPVHRSRTAHVLHERPGTSPRGSASVWLTRRTLTTTMATVVALVGLYHI